MPGFDAKRFEPKILAGLFVYISPAMKFFDVAIIGASISGATLAACLGMESLAVALIDKDRFPRRKACGEGLSNVALHALDRMGFETEKATGTGMPYFAYRMDIGSRSFEFASGRDRHLKGVGIQRMLLDQVILDRASNLPPVSSYLETSATQIERSGPGFALSLSSGDQITARHLVLADGANSKTASKLGVPVRRKAPPLWGISFILEGTFHQTTGEVLVLLKDGFEINCTPVSKNRLNITFLSSREQVKPLQDPGFRDRLLAEAAEKSFFTGKPIEKPLQVGPVSAARRPYVHDGIMLVGDAAENLDPVAGMGMTHGILMAEIAAQSLLSISQGGKSPESAFSQYSILAERMSRPYRGFTRLTASLLRSPARRILLPPLSSTFLPGMIRSALDDAPSEIPLAASLPRQFLSLVGA